MVLFERMSMLFIQGINHTGLYMFVNNTGFKTIALFERTYLLVVEYNSLIIRADRHLIYNVCVCIYTHTHTQRAVYVVNDAFQLCPVPD